MKLKELRISQSLTQTECANYLGVSLRTYQNYENDSTKEHTYKYIDMCNKLKSRTDMVAETIFKYDDIYHTNVVVGDGLNNFYNGVAKYRKRDCYELLKKFIVGDYTGKVCILYGLRRTGKTTLIFQMLKELPLQQVAYIKIQTTDTMANLTKDLYNLHKLGYKYIFIDEITLLADFINTASVLSDIFSMFGMKIVLSGTDSLGFVMANRDELYDRCIMIHTSFISYREYEKLLNIHSIDSYIEYGGTLKMENMTFDDPDIQLNDISFRNDETTRKYIDTSISRNIQHTLKNDHFGEYFNQLKELYNKGELTNAINRIVENINHDFLVKVIEDEFKSHDLGSARNLLLHDVPSSIAYALEEIDKTSVIKRLKSLLDIKEKNETKVKITQECVDKIKKYLLMLDLIVNCPDRYESGKKVDHYIFSQPGMRYSITKALVYSLLQDEYFKSLSESDKEYITNKVLTDVKGRMLEEIVLLEVNKVIHKNKEAFKFKFDAGGEYDMIIYDKSTNTCKLYEIKHSDKIDDRQIRFLVDKDKCELIENKYGTIVGKYVLYRGQNKKIESIDYINVEVFLTKLKYI